MYRHAKIDSLVWIPYENLTNKQARQLMSKLTITPKRFGNQPQPAPIKMYVNDTERKALGLPIRFALELMSPESYLCTDGTSEGHPIHVSRFPDPRNPKASPGQEKFMRDMLQAAYSEYSFLAEAPTGSGKTVAALNTIGKLNRTALVIVGTKTLARQWRREVTTHLGIPPELVGAIEEGVADWEGKDVVVAVVHNLADQQWPPALYQYFGIVVWDEAHRLGARMFSRTLKQFPAKYKWAMTATPYRKDGCEALFLTYFGAPLVNGTKSALPMDAYVLDYLKKGKRYGREIPLPIR